MDKLVCIETFIEIVERGSLRKAAAALHQTEAGISKRLSRLEQSLKFKLLERGRSGLKLSDMGQQYFTACKEAMEKLEKVDQLMQTATTTPQGELKVTCNRFYAERYVMPKLNSFLKKYPKILLNFNITEQFPNFLDHKIDLLFGFGAALTDKQDLVQKRIGVTREILCATNTYLKKMKPVKKPSDLNELHYLSHNQRRPLDVVLLDKNIDVKLTPFIIFDDTELILNAALKNSGFVYVKQYVAEPYLKSGQLIELLPKYNKNEISIYAYYRYQTYLDPKIRVFIDYFS